MLKYIKLSVYILLCGIFFLRLSRPAFDFFYINEMTKQKNLFFSYFDKHLSDAYTTIANLNRMSSTFRADFDKFPGRLLSINYEFCEWDAGGNSLAGKSPEIYLCMG